jgi:subtilisin family serine protease
MHLRRHAILLSLAFVASSVIPTGVAAADPTPPPAITDEILVRYASDSTPAQRRAASREAGVDVLSTSADGLTEVVIGKGISRATVSRRLDANPRVVAIAPNYRRELVDEITDEPFFASEWGLHNTGQTLSGTETKTGIADVDIDGLEALRITLGRPDIVVAVIDDGVDFGHPDLTGRRWVNPGETPNNGQDDDDNGFVDDVNGWDFCDDDATVGPAAGGGHGTHVAGTIAGSLNGTGVVGVAPGIKVMALKFIENASCGTDEQAIAAIDYAASFGVPVINASWGGTGRSSVLDLAIAQSGALFVAAAGNDGLDLDEPGNDFYPAETNAPNVLSVAAIDQRGQVSDFSNYGAAAVDIGAPGSNVLSSYPGGYAWADGTSMAAPHVSGVAALIDSVVSGLTPAQVKSRILSRGTTLSSLVGTTVSGRLVNAARVLDTAGPTALPVSRHEIRLGSLVGTTVSSTIVWPFVTDTESQVASYAVRRRVAGGAWSTIASGLTGRTLITPLTLSTQTQFAIVATDTVGNVGPAAESAAVTPTLYQEKTSLATYTGRWTNTISSTASNRNLRTSTQAGASVTFRRSGIAAVAVVGRQGPTSGRASIYVDGVLVTTIDTVRSVARNKVVLFSKWWPTAGTHTVKVVVAGTAGRPRIDIDGFAVIR